jgi:hypothetical protein
VKHIDIMHFARDHVASGELVFLYCKSEDNVSDCLTKALPRPLLQVGQVGLGMLRVRFGLRLSVRRGVLRCGVRVHEWEGMHDVIIVWPDRAAAWLWLTGIRRHIGASHRCVSLLMLATKV